MDPLNIDTSQHVQIDYLPAGAGARVGAFFIDAFIMIIYILFISLVVTRSASENITILVTVIALLPLLFYHLLFEMLMAGQSPGKKAVDIKVIKKKGTPVTFGSYLLRWIFRLIDITITTGSLAFFTILINGQGQRLGDIAAGTAVVKTKKKTTLSDTLYIDIEEGYTPRYPEVVHLSDHDISVVKEVLNEGKKYDRNTQRKMTLKTRNAVKDKMGIELSNDIDPRKFLRTVVKDYNYIHG